jgi:hypothetical protein
MPGPPGGYRFWFTTRFGCIQGWEHTGEPADGACRHAETRIKRRCDNVFARLGSKHDVAMQRFACLIL